MHVLTFSNFTNKLSCRKPLGGFSGFSPGTLEALRIFSPRCSSSDAPESRVVRRSRLDPEKLIFTGLMCDVRYGSSCPAVHVTVEILLICVLLT